MIAKIWYHNFDDMGIILGAKLPQGVLAHTLVGEVKYNPDVRTREELLDAIFDDLQNDEGDEVKNLLGTTERSMSVGDMVEFAEDDIWVCMMIGWKKLP